MNVEDNQARRLLNDLASFTAHYDLGREDRHLVAGRWMTQIYEPIMEMVPPRGPRQARAGRDLPRDPRAPVVPLGAGRARGRHLRHRPRLHRQRAHQEARRADHRRHRRRGERPRAPSGTGLALAPAPGRTHDRPPSPRARRHRRLAHPQRRGLRRPARRVHAAVPGRLAAAGPPLVGHLGRRPARRPRDGPRVPLLVARAARSRPAASPASRWPRRAAAHGPARRPDGDGARGGAARAGRGRLDALPDRARHLPPLRLRDRHQPARGRARRPTA